MRCRECRQPRGSRRSADADITGEIGAIQELRRAECRGPQETLVVPQACNLEELAEVPFEIGRHVGTEKTLGVDIEILVELGKPAPHEKRLNAEVRMGRTGFGKRERFELDDGGAPRQRIGDRLHESERLRAGQEEGARASAVAIDRRLQVAKEAGRVLHLVDDDGRRMPSKK